jgi:hypothetical protein
MHNLAALHQGFSIMRRCRCKQGGQLGESLPARSSTRASVEGLIGFGLLDDPNGKVTGENAKQGSTSRIRSYPSIFGLSFGFIAFRIWS